jgi:hypothetical protein
VSRLLRLLQEFGCAEDKQEIDILYRREGDLIATLNDAEMCRLADAIAERLAYFDHPPTIQTAQS